MKNSKVANIQKTNRHWFLYVLKLQQDKWYVGITSQTPEKRLQEHLNGRKSYWTEQYTPIKIVQTVDLGDLDKEAAELYEKKVTREYMKAKGINNVRGGDLTQKNDYVVRFGYVFDKLGWEVITVIILELLVILGLLLDKYQLI